MREERIRHGTPGEVLLEHFLKPLGLSQNALGLYMCVPPQRINEIVRGKRPITLDTALRLARFFENSPEFWLRLQMQHDLHKARLSLLQQKITREIPVQASELGDSTESFGAL